MITPEIVEQYFPKAVQWATEMEKAILESGHRLSPEQRKDAEAIGVLQLDEVRIISLPNIPFLWKFYKTLKQGNHHEKN